MDIIVDFTTKICCSGLEGLSRMATYSFLSIISAIWLKDIFLSALNFKSFSSSHIIISVPFIPQSNVYAMYISKRGLSIAYPMNELWQNH